MIKINPFNPYFPLSTKLRAFKLETPRRPLVEREGYECRDCGKWVEDMMERCGCQDDCRLCGRSNSACNCDQLPQGDGEED